MISKYFRRKLLELQDELEATERVGNTDADTAELDQQRQGRLSRMDALSAQAMTRAAEEQRRKTLARLGSGDFGLCTQCVDEIDPRRLEFAPSAQLCTRMCEQGGGLSGG